MPTGHCNNLPDNTVIIRIHNYVTQMIIETCVAYTLGLLERSEILHVIPSS